MSGPCVWSDSILLHRPLDFSVCSFFRGYRRPRLALFWFIVKWKLYRIHFINADEVLPKYSNKGQLRSRLNLA